MLEFNVGILCFVSFFTLFCYRHVSKRAKGKQRIFLLFTYLFIFLYSGIGGALKEANINYTLFYSLYILLLTFTISHSRIIMDFSKESNVLVSFIDRNGNKIITVYFMFMLFSLIYPEFKLMNLISPPPPSLLDHDFEAADKVYEGGALSSIIHFASSLMLPLLYISLYKFRNNLKMVIAILFLNLYFMYCQSGYVGRGSILQFLVICFFTCYYSLSEKRRKILLITVALCVPSLLYFFFWYSFVRMDATLEQVSLDQVIQELFRQEIGYPLHYDDYINHCGKYGMEYLEWFFLQPLPGFLKFGYGNLALNREFSMDLLGLDVSESGFFIILPGVIGESLYTFGPVLFGIHAILLGLVIKFYSTSFLTSPCFTFFYYFCIMQLSYVLGRGGTVSTLPIMIKTIVIMAILRYCLKKQINQTR